MVTKFPGLIDMHVHLREPGATHKEDFYTGSRSAVKGGFTFVADMPNNPTPTFSPELLEEKISLSKKAICGVGFHFGTNGNNTESFLYAIHSPRVFGLKLYCNHTTGDNLIEDLKLLEDVFSSWKSDKPILVHAEGVQLAAVIALSKFYSRRLHVCHISQKAEVTLVRLAKISGQQVSAGVTPHHLFLTESDTVKQGAWCMMKPPLGSKQDQASLWEAVEDGTIDIVETDHAPHTKEEKQKDKSPYGVPGLETALGLLLSAVHKKKLTIAKIKKLFYEAPKNLFGIPDQPGTYIEFDPDKPYTVGKEGFETKCDWSPFDGWEVYGAVETVVYNGKTVLKNGMFNI